MINFFKKAFLIKFIHGLISKHTFIVSKILFCSNNKSYNLEDATTLFIGSKDSERCFCFKKIRATLCTEKKSHHNSEQHRHCITFDQMNNVCYNLTALQLLEHSKLVTSYCSIILKPWSWCCFIYSLSLPFFSLKKPHETPFVALYSSFCAVLEMPRRKSEVYLGH